MTNTKYLFLLFLLLPTLALAQSNNEPIHTPLDLKGWCEEESKRYFLSRGLSPSNWTASWWEAGDMLHTKGSWTIEGNKAPTQCHIRRGDTKQSVGINITFKGASFSPVIQKNDHSINTTTELENWCKTQSQRYLLSKKKLPRNWSAFGWTQGNKLHTKGKWRVDNDEVSITCHTRRGSGGQGATMEIVGQ